MQTFAEYKLFKLNGGHVSTCHDTAALFKKKTAMVLMCYVKQTFQKNCFFIEYNPFSVFILVAFLF